MATKKTDWNTAFKPLLKKYKKEKHPLNYESIYQLMVMVVLSAQDNDTKINNIAPELFKAFPTMKMMSKANAEDLHPYISKVRGFTKKADWITRIAKQIKDDKNIPNTMDALVELPGIGRKSANVIMREAKVKAEGIMVDLHVVRVAQRLGITKNDKPEKIEQDLMEQVNEKLWSDIGMAISYLGRDTCRPKEPHQEDCVMKEVCKYYKKLHHIE